MNIVLEITLDEHMRLSVEGSQEQCDLQESLAIEFANGLGLLVDGERNRMRRQADMNGGFDAFVSVSSILYSYVHRYA